MKKSQHVYLAHYSVTYITYFENPPFETTHIHRKKIGSEIAAYVFYYLAHYSVTYIDNPPFETTHTQKKILWFRRQVAKNAGLIFNRTTEIH